MQSKNVIQSGNAYVSWKHFTWMWEKKFYFLPVDEKEAENFSHILGLGLDQGHQSHFLFALFTALFKYLSMITQSFDNPMLINADQML